jgi:hypothetical protein
LEISVVASNDTNEPEEDNGGDKDDTAAGGSIQAEGYTVYWGYGGSVASAESSGYTITADSGYAIDEIWVDGQRLDSYDAYHNQTSYTYSGTPNNSVVVYFAYTVNFNTPANGSLTVQRGSETLTSGDIVRGGDVLTITASANDGYELDSLAVVGLHDNENGTYTVSAKNGDDTPAVSVSFKEKEQTTQPEQPAASTYSIVTSYGTDHGTVTYSVGGAAVQSASQGDTVTVKIQPDANYELSNISVYGGYSLPLTKVDNHTYQFTMPAATVYVSAYYQAAATVTTATYGDTVVEEGTAYTVKDGGTAVGSYTISHQTVATFNTAGTRAELTEEVTVAVTPQSGYLIQGVYYTDKNHPSTKQEVSPTGTEEGSGAVTYTFQATGAICVYVQFGRAYTLTTAETAHGTVRLSASTATAGTSITVTTSADENYALKSLTYSTGSGDPVTITGGSFEMPAADVTVTATFDEQDVVRIATEQELRAFAESVNSGTDYSGMRVVLSNSIALQAAWTTPIGTREHPFTGVFEGGGYTISGLNIQDMTEFYQGLFGYIQNATIKDLTVSGTISTTAADACIGGLIAQANNSTISGCTATVSINVRGSYVGGLVGIMNTGTMENCTNQGTIVVDYTDVVNGGASYVGGLIGSASDGVSMRQCANYADITYRGGKKVRYEDGSSTNWSWIQLANGRFGGLIGGAGSVTVDSCTNKGDITGDMQLAGGLVGDAIGAGITNSYNTGNVTSTASFYDVRVRLGGLVGTSNFCGGTLTLTNCYNIGAVTAAYISTNVNQGPKTDAIQCNGVDYNQHGGGTAVQTITNTYSTSQSAQVTASTLGESYQVDGNLINGGYPLLSWESATASETTYDVTFQIEPANATVTLFRGTEQLGTGTAYQLTQGVYRYQIEAAGYLTQAGTFTVKNSSVALDISLKEAVTVTFRVTPAEAEFALCDASGSAVTPESSVNGVYTFQLAVGDVYTYDASYKTDTVEYITISRQLEVPASNKTVEVALEQKKQAGGTIYGDGNGADEAHPYRVTAGGEYYIGDGATGTLYIDTTETVTLVGSGTSKSAMYQNLYIECVEGVDLTLQDVYISVETSADKDSSVKNLLNFTGSGNSLTFSGTNVLDMNTNASNYAAIHVGSRTDLTITGGTAYIYKNEQAAAIGGGNGSAESNGDITISNATLYIKGSKQGALIGPSSGASCSGSITITNSDLNLLANARGAAIGGSAGTSGASSGGTVTISGSRVNINVDFSGAAIGGGGYDGGNDASGGTLVVSNSSIRAYIDANATSSWDVTSAGVNGNIAITADVVNSKGESLYLLTVDTSSLSGKSFTIKEGNTTVYSGGLHTEQYIGADTGKTSVTYTQDNWTSLNDPNLYLYLTGEDHELTINGDTYRATWDETTKTFTLQHVDYDDVTVVDSTTTVSAGAATVSVTDTAVEAALKESDAAGTDTLYIIADAASANADSTAFTVSKTALGLIADADKELVCDTYDGTKITLSADALRSIADQPSKTTAGNQVTITVTPLTKAEAETALKNADRGDVELDNTVALEVTVEANGQSITFTDGFDIDVPVSSSVFTKGSSYSVLWIGEDGSTETLTAKCEENDGSLYLHIEADEGGTFILLSTTPLSLYDGMTTVTSTTTVKNGAATVTVTDDAVTDAITAAKKSKDDTLVIVADPDSTKITTTNFAISRKALNSIKTAEMGLVLETYDGTRTTLSDTAMASIAAKAEKETVTVSVTPKTQAEALTAIESAKDLDAADFDLENSVAVEILIQSNDKTITGVDDGFGVYLPVGSSYSKGSKYQVLWIGADGSSETLTGTCVEWNGQRYLSFKADESGTFVVAADATVSYTDVAQDDWYYDAVAFVTRRGLMTGTATGVFSPNVNMTRAMLVTVLYRMEGLPANETGADFTDVADGSWYADAVTWAKTNGIVDGYGNGRFGPNDEITREQTALILMRYAQYKGYDVTATAELSAYSDAADIDSWALSAMQWANATGLIQGLTDTTLAPRSSTSRAQMATLLMRYIQNIVE